MSDKLDQLNAKNFQEICRLLHGLEFFPFFGTLLGLVRRKELIKGDDDVDFYVSESDRQRVIDRLGGTDIVIDLNAPINQGPCFLQGVRTQNGEKSYVDFYFFESPPEKNYLRERWNFSGRWRRKSNAIHIPLTLIYPLRDSIYLDRQVPFPNDPDGCCEFLYGKAWKTPLAKKTQYKSIILANRPFVYRNRILSKISVFFLKVALSIINPERLWR
jgi:hypothetical protein